LSNDTFKDEKGILRAMKVQQNGRKCYAAIPSQKSDSSKN